MKNKKPWVMYLIIGLLIIIIGLLVYVSVQLSSYSNHEKTSTTELSTSEQTTKETTTSKSTTKSESTLETVADTTMDSTQVQYTDGFLEEYKRAEQATVAFENQSSFASEDSATQYTKESIQSKLNYFNALLQQNPFTNEEQEKLRNLRDRMQIKYDQLSQEQLASNQITLAELSDYLTNTERYIVLTGEDNVSFQFYPGTTSVMNSMAQMGNWSFDVENQQVSWTINGQKTIADITKNAEGRIVLTSPEHGTFKKINETLVRN